MGRGILLAVGAVLAASAARAGAPSAWEHEEYRRRLAAERTRIEGSAGYRDYWAGGQKKWTATKGSVGQMPSADLPAVPGDGGKTDEIAKLIGTLKTGKGAEKVEARNALVKMGPAAIGALAKALGSEDIAVRGSASMVLKKLGPAAMSAVLPLTDVKNRQVRSSAISVVQRIIKKEHVGAVAAKIESAEHADCRRGLVKAVQKALSARDVDVVVAILGNCKDANLKRAMAAFASSSGSLKALPGLLAMGNSSDQNTQRLGAYGVQILLQRAQKADLTVLYAAYLAAKGPVRKVIGATVRRLAGWDPSSNDFKFMVYVRQNRVPWPPRR